MHHYIKCSCYQNYYTLIKSVSAVRPVTIALHPDSSLPRKHMRRLSSSRLQRRHYVPGDAAAPSRRRASCHPA
ncbi:unnamed protein product, partial [Tenebrio molitor]